MLSYGSNLAPRINNSWSHELIGKPTDPTRFDEKDLLEREASYGRIGFQYAIPVRQFIV